MAYNKLRSDRCKTYLYNVHGIKTSKLDSLRRHMKPHRTATESQIITETNVNTTKTAPEPTPNPP